MVWVMQIFILAAGGTIRTARETVQVQDAAGKFHSRKGREKATNEQQLVRVEVWAGSDTPAWG